MDVRHRSRAEQDSPVPEPVREWTDHKPPKAHPLVISTNPSTVRMLTILIQDYATFVYRVCLHWPLLRELLRGILNKLPTNVSNIFSVKNTYNPETDVPDLTGKVAMVTGGSLPFIWDLIFSEPPI